MNGKKISQTVVQCNEILKTSPDCAAEIDLLLGTLARHPDWTEPELMELQRQLVLDFADQLCERR